nr:MAG TPA: YopX protein [Caudoviricetes sp.]
MREIKVRAWHKSYKQMCEVESLRFDGNGVYAAVLIDEPFYDRKLVEADEIVIEQFTGLKDINGREIYEGDIVKYYPHHRGVPYRVYWADRSAKFLIGRDGVIGQSFSDIMHNLNTGRIALEVVGNIHENPELLEEK